ncbi:MAG: prepilin-type N-terminal cleavage/methylation domain-containing protein [Deltaproteobacteria bacterium]
MKSGFTLVELMVVVLLTSVVMSALFMVMSSGRSAWFEADTQVAVQQELRKAMREMTRELSMSGASQVSVADDSSIDTSISFNISNGSTAGGGINWIGPINYSVSAGQLLRINGSDTRVLANNVSSLAFLRASSPSRLLHINATVAKNTVGGRTINVTHEAAVFLRN